MRRGYTMRNKTSRIITSTLGACLLSLGAALVSSSSLQAQTPVKRFTVEANTSITDVKSEADFNRDGVIDVLTVIFVGGLHQISNYRRWGSGLR
jgi:hypothetical protein